MTSKQERFIVVGGTAVDAYVSGAFGTSEGYPAGWRESLDVDTIVLSPRASNGRSRLLDSLEEAGFTPTPTGGSFSLEGVPYALDIVAHHLPEDYSREHLVPLTLDIDSLDTTANDATGREERRQTRPKVTLVGPEDLLFDYLESAVATRHQRDWARALAIAQTLGEDLDLGYLYGKAHQRRDGAFVPDLDRLLEGEPLPRRS